MTSNVNEKLKESFSTGTGARNGLKKVSALGTKVGFIIFGVLAGLWLLLFAIPNWMEPPKSDGAGAARSTTNSGDAYVPGAKVTLLKAGEVSPMFPMPAGLCLKKWADNDPDGTSFITEYRGMHDKTWRTEAEFRALQVSGEINYNPGYARYVGKANGTKVYHVFEPLGLVPDCWRAKGT